MARTACNVHTYVRPRDPEESSGLIYIKFGLEIYYIVEGAPGVRLIILSHLTPKRCAIVLTNQFTES